MRSGFSVWKGFLPFLKIRFSLFGEVSTYCFAGRLCLRGEVTKPRPSAAAPRPARLQPFVRRQPARRGTCAALPGRPAAARNRARALVWRLMPEGCPVPPNATLTLSGTIGRKFGTVWPNSSRRAVDTGGRRGWVAAGAAGRSSTRFLWLRELICGV